jgi:hypothetical protein
MGAAVTAGCVSGTLCVVVLESAVGDCWGAGEAGCVEAEVAGTCTGSALGADDAVGGEVTDDEAALPGDVGEAATDDAVGDEAACAGGADGVRADAGGACADPTDVDSAEPVDAGGAGSAMDTVVDPASAASRFPKSIHTPLAAAGGTACLRAGFGAVRLAATVGAAASGVIVNVISVPAAASSYFPARCRSTTRRVTGGLGSFSP